MCMFTTDLFIITITWKPPRCTSGGNGKYIVVCLHNKILSNHKKEEIMEIFEVMG